MNQLSHALALADWNIAVFPCRSNKAPYTPNGFKDATRNPALILKYWTKWPDALIGYLPVSAGGAICVDVDEGGKEAIRRVIEIARAKPWCIVPSGTKGRYHILFLKGPSEVTEGAWKQEWGSGDIRHKEGYLIAHYPDLLLYQMVNREAEESMITDSLGALKTPCTTDSLLETREAQAAQEAPKGNGATRPAPTPPNDFKVPVVQVKYPDTLNEAATELRGLTEGRRTYLNGATLKFAVNGHTEQELEILLDAIESTGYPNMPDARRCFRLAIRDGRAMSEGKQKKKSDKTFPLTDQGLMAALASIGYSMKFDNRRQTELWKRGDGEWEPSNNRLTDYIRSRLAEHCYLSVRRYSKKTLTPYEMNNDRWRQLRNSLAYQNEFDPFLEWIQALPEWDGQARVERALCLIQGAEDTELNRFASKSIFLGAIRRAFHPGCEHKSMPVLIGDQHIGKSSYIQSLIPLEHRSAWIGEKLPVKAKSSREQVEALLGNVLIEYAELGDVGWNIESVKAFLSTRTDKVRLAWRTDSEVMPRRCIFIGTSNPKGSGELPNDPTGNVRFMAVPVVGCSKGAEWASEWMDENRSQLWSEALAMYRAGEDSNLPPHLIQPQEAVNLMYRESDEMYEIPLRRLIVRGELSGEMTLVDIGRLLKKEEVELINEVPGNRLAKALLNLGAEKLSKTRKGRLWRLPKLTD